uniref:Uncharacterized protein LOC114333977 n=1 Tax=Diabrotica virgifera virgifera TaxID=50390 RepID=A0A6P7FTZ1_DIAVI
MSAISNKTINTYMFCISLSLYLNSDPDVRKHRKKRVFSSSESEGESRSKKKPKKKGINLQTPRSWHTPTVLSDDETISNATNTNSSIICSSRDSMEIPTADANFREANLKETDDVSEITDDIHNCKCDSQMLYNIQSLLIDVNKKLDKLSAKPQQSLEEPSIDDVLEKTSLELPADSQKKLENLEQFLASSENYKSLKSNILPRWEVLICMIL